MAVVITNLTNNVSTSNPLTTASVSPAAGSVVYVSVAVAQNGGVGGGAAGTLAVSGCGLTWSQVSWQGYGDRRIVFVWKGVGTPSSGALTITYTPDASYTFQEFQYSVDQVTGLDGTTPNDAAVSVRTVASVNLLDLPDVGTPGAGDVVFCAFGFEGATDNLVLSGSITQHIYRSGGANVRSLIIGYEGGTPDETPGVTWTTSGNGAGGIAFILNVAAGGGGFVSLSDAIVYALLSGEAFLRYLSDPMGLSDSIQGRMTAGRNVADLAGMTDGVSKASAFTRLLSDVGGMTDSISAAQSLARLLSDAMDASDSTVRAAGAVRQFADDLGITDYLFARKVLVRALSDSVGTSDVVSRAMAYAAFLSDPMGVADFEDQSSAHARVSSDNVGMEDAISAARGLFRNLSELMGVEDALAAVVAAGGETFVRLISDTMTLTDPDMDAGEAMVRFVAESVGITDESVIQAAYARYVAADMGMVDSAVRTMGHARIQTETLGMTDAVYSIAFLLIYRTAADAMGVSDSSARYHGVVRFLSDTLGIEDGLDRASVHARILSELAGVTDTTDRAVAIIRQVSESLGLTDADIATLVSGGVTYTRIITDALGITDAKYQASAVATWLMIVLSLRRMVFLEAAGPFVTMEASFPGLVQASAAGPFPAIDVAEPFVTIEAYRL